MLTAEGCRARRQRLWDQFEHPLDWILLSDPKTLVYFANYAPSPFVFRSTYAGGVLLLGRDGSSVLVADSMVRPYAEKAAVDQTVLPTWYDGKRTAPPRREFLVANVLEEMSGRPGERIGIEQGTLPAGIIEGLRRDHPTTQFFPVDAVIHTLRRSKDPDEVALIRQSIAAIDAAMDLARSQVKPGMTELEVFLLIQQSCCQTAGQQVQVYGDFVSGPNTLAGGGPPTDRTIEAGDLVLLDFSAVIQEYRGDFANTFCCAAEPSPEQQRLFEACLEAINAGEQLLRPGQPCRDIDAAVRGSLAEKGLEKNFSSHVGHGLGLGHPDPPYIVPESEDTLVVGDVITLEPGQFVPGVGGMRFEHNYLITSEGYQRLSQHQPSLRQTS